MRKITKLTALALALALVLGMTVMAAPTEVIKTVDFSGYANIDELKADAINKSFIKNDALTFGEGGVAYDKMYYESAVVNPNWKYLDLVEMVGVKAVGSNKAMWSNGDQKGNQIGFTFPEALVYDEDYAFVVETGFAAPTRVRTGLNYHYQNNDWPGVAGLLSTKAADADETSTVRTLAGWYWDDEAFGVLQCGEALDFANQNSTTSGSVMPLNSIGTLTTVIRPYEKSEDGSLDILMGYDRMGRYMGYHQNGQPIVTKVHGIIYSDHFGYEQWGVTGYKFYKVSLDPADFAITSSKNLEDLEVDEEVKITFSQPISKNVVDNEKGGATLETLITVASGDDVLVYGEDYTLTIDAKANGNAVYDEITIAPVGDWGYGKNFTVTFPEGFKNIARVPMAETAVVNFATVAAPVFDITLKAYKGLNASGNELSALEAGTTCFVISATYSSGKVVTNGKLRFELLDGEGNVVNYVTNKKDLTSTAAFNTVFRVEDGYTARVTLDGGIVGTASIGAAN